MAVIHTAVSGTSEAERTQRPAGKRVNIVHDPAGQETSATTITKHPPPSPRGPLLGVRSLRFNFNTVALVLRGRLDADEAAQRARMLREDLPRLGGRLRLRAVERSPGEHWPFYAVGPHLVPPRFFRPSHRPGYHATGYGLDWGDLVTLSKVVKLARELWGLNWPCAYRTQLRLNRNHLPTIEELWWLSLWHQPTGTERECALAGCCGQTVDWRFQCRGITVNLEVKYRPHDWLRFVNARAYGRLLRGYLRTLAGKFPVRPRGHLNVVGLTLLGSLGEELRGHAVDFLRTHPAIDALCFWSIARRDSLACECVTQPGSSLVLELLRPADEEDRWRNPFILHTTRPDQIANCPSQPDFQPWQGLFDSRGPAWCAHWRNVMRAWLFAVATVILTPTVLPWVPTELCRRSEQRENPEVVESHPFCMWEMKSRPDRVSVTWPNPIRACASDRTAASGQAIPVTAIGSRTMMKMPARVPAEMPADTVLRG